MDRSNKTGGPGTRISPRILRHLIKEASELLEEAQTHALVEKQTEVTASILSETSWRMTATCLWAIGELFPGNDDRDHAAQLHAPLPLFVRPDGEAPSAQFANFYLRANRLHERARRLDELSGGPMVSTEDTADTPVQGTRGMATIVPLFGQGSIDTDVRNPIAAVHSQVRHAMAGRE